MSTQAALIGPSTRATPQQDKASWTWIICKFSCSKNPANFPLSLSELCAVINTSSKDGMSFFWKFQSKDTSTRETCVQSKKGTWPCSSRECLRFLSKLEGKEPPVSREIMEVARTPAISIQCWHKNCLNVFNPGAKFCSIGRDIMFQCSPNEVKWPKISVNTQWFFGWVSSPSRASFTSTRALHMGNSLVFAAVHVLWKLFERGRDLVSRSASRNFPVSGNFFIEISRLACLTDQIHDMA